MKIAIIGAGRVGATTAYTLLDRKLTSELLLIDVREEYLEGAKLDLQSAFPFAKIYLKGKIEDYDIIVMTAGFPRTPAMKSRNELFEVNQKIFNNVFSGKKFKKGTKIIVVTNPVELLSDYLTTLTGLPKKNIIRFGNQLDSNRLKFISQNKNAYVYGGHDENMKMSEGFEKYEKEVKKFSMKIVEACGGTIFGPAKTIADVVSSISKA
jgi:malate/lactate dehydrogenase